MLHAELLDNACAWVGFSGTLRSNEWTLETFGEKDPVRYPCIVVTNKEFGPDQRGIMHYIFIYLTDFSVDYPVAGQLWKQA
jgi:hypothetical protein